MIVDFTEVLCQGCEAVGVGVAGDDFGSGALDNQAAFFRMREVMAGLCVKFIEGGVSNEAVLSEQFIEIFLGIRDLKSAGCGTIEYALVDGTCHLQAGVVHVDRRR